VQRCFGLALDEGAVSLTASPAGLNGGKNFLARLDSRLDKCYNKGSVEKLNMGRVK